MIVFDSWITPALEWIEIGEKFCIEITADCKDAVELIAKGSIKIDPIARKDVKSIAKACSIFADRNVYAECLIRAAQSGGLTNTNAGQSEFFLIDIYRSSVSTWLLLLSAKRKPFPEINLEKPHLQAKAEALFQTYQAEHLAREKNEQDFRPWPQPPTMAELNEEFKEAVWVSKLPKSEKKRSVHVLKAINLSGRPPSRNGIYYCHQIDRSDGSQAAIISWIERTLSPSTIEIKSALEKQIRRSFSAPRIEAIAPPRYNLAGQTISGNYQFDLDIDSFMTSDLSDYLPRPTGEGRSAHELDGFDAVAWYQPFHRFKDQSWGIFFDSQKLDLLAADLIHDLKAGYNFGAYIAFNLVLAHELFHAKLEIISSILEMSMRKPLGVHPV